LNRRLPATIQKVILVDLRFLIYFSDFLIIY